MCDSLSVMLIDVLSSVLVVKLMSMCCRLISVWCMRLLVDVRLVSVLIMCLGGGRICGVI